MKSAPMVRQFVLRVLTVSHLRNRPNLQQLCYLSSSSSTTPNGKLFVAGLSWSVGEKCLKEAFSSFGEVREVRIVYDKESGRSRGFGFVDFLKEDDAECAKNAMDGKALMGRPLRISFALERVRGTPVVVPQLRNVGNNYTRKT